MYPAYGLGTLDGQRELASVRKRKKPSCVRMKRSLKRAQANADNRAKFSERAYATGSDIQNQDGGLWSGLARRGWLSCRRCVKE